MSASNTQGSQDCTADKREKALQAALSRNKTLPLPVQDESLEVPQDAQFPSDSQLSQALDAQFRTDSFLAQQPSNAVALEDLEESQATQARVDQNLLGEILMDSRPSDRVIRCVFDQVVMGSQGRVECFGRASILGQHLFVKTQFANLEFDTLTRASMASSGSARSRSRSPRRAPKRSLSAMTIGSSPGGPTSPSRLGTGADGPDAEP